MSKDFGDLNFNISSIRNSDQFKDKLKSSDSNIESILNYFEMTLEKTNILLSMNISEDELKKNLIERNDDCRILIKICQELYKNSLNNSHSIPISNDNNLAIFDKNIDSNLNHSDITFINEFEKQIDHLIFDNDQKIDEIVEISRNHNICLARENLLMDQIVQELVQKRKENVLLNDKLQIYNNQLNERGFDPNLSLHSVTSNIISDQPLFIGDSVSMYKNIKNDKYRKSVQPNYDNETYISNNSIEDNSNNRKKIQMIKTPENTRLLNKWKELNKKCDGEGLNGILKDTNKFNFNYSLKSNQNIPEQNPSKPYMKKNARYSISTSKARSSPSSFDRHNSIENDFGIVLPKISKPSRGFSIDKTD